MSSTLQGGVMHTERDAEIAAWVGRLGAAGAAHVMERFAMGRSRAYERLSFLVGEGLLEQRALLHQQPGLYVATAEGLRWCGISRLGAYRLSAGGFAHAREVAAAAVALQRGFPAWEVLSEREIRAQEAEAARPLASAKVGELAGGRPLLHRPDLAVVSPDRRVIAVEVELTAKAPARLAAICRGWARARHIDVVYYLAALAAASAVQRAIAGTRAHDRITVIPLAETTKVAALEGSEATDVRA
jgi:hypothetical protein